MLGHGRVTWIARLRAARHLRVAVLCLVLWTPACTSWSHPEPPSPVDLAPNRQVRVWTAERTWRLHAVRFTSDSLTGVPYQQPTSCDSCRVAVPLAKVDSIQTGGGSEGRAIALIAVPIVLVGTFIMVANNSEPMQ
jgi:hypothetical protein